MSILNSKFLSHWVVKQYSKYNYFLLNYFIFGIGFGLNLVIGTFGETSESAHYFLLLSVALPFLGVLFYYTNYPSSSELKHNYFNYISALTKKNTFLSIIILFILVGIIVFLLKTELTIYDFWIIGNLILFEFFCQIDRLKLQFNKVFFFTANGIITKVFSILFLLIFQNVDLFFITIMLFNFIVAIKYLYRKRGLDFDSFGDHEIKVSGQLLVVGALNSFIYLLLNKYLLLVNSTDKNMIINNLLIRVVNLFSVGLKSFAERYTISSLNNKYYVQYLVILIFTFTYFYLEVFPGYVIGAVSFTTSMCKLDFVKNYLHKKPKYIFYSSLTWVATNVVAFFTLNNLYASIIIGYLASSLITMIISRINRDLGTKVIMLNIVSILILLLCIL